MVAYGIGSINDTIISQYQFACALALHEELNIHSSIEIYDPAMGRVDVIIYFSHFRKTLQLLLN